MIIKKQHIIIPHCILLRKQVEVEQNGQKEPFFKNIYIFSSIIKLLLLQNCNAVSLGINEYYLLII